MTNGCFVFYIDRHFFPSSQRMATQQEQSDMATKALSTTIQHWITPSNQKSKKLFEERLMGVLYDKWSFSILQHLSGVLHDSVANNIEQYAQTFIVARGHSRWMVENGVRTPPCPDCGTVSTQLEIAEEHDEEEDEGFVPYVSSVCKNKDCQCALVYVWQ